MSRDIEDVLDEGKTISLQVSESPKSKPKNPTLDEFWRSFYSWAVDNRARTTLEEYTIWFSQLRSFTNAERIGDIGQSEIEAFKAALSKQGKHKPTGVGLDKKSINNALRTLTAIWNHAIRLGIYTGDNPAADVERYKLPQNLDKDYLDTEQVEALLKAACQYFNEKYVRRSEAVNVYLVFNDN